MKLIELESPPEQFGVIILSDTPDAVMKFKDGFYNLCCRIQINQVYMDASQENIIQEIIRALESREIRCRIITLIQQVKGTIFDLYVKAPFAFSVKFVKKQHGPTW